MRSFSFSAFLSILEGVHREILWPYHKGILLGTSDTDIHDVLLLHRGKSSVKSLAEAVQSGGHTTRVVTEAEDIAAHIPELRDPVLLVYLQEEEEKALEDLKLVVGMKELRSQPLILIGKEADGYTSVLDRYFTLCLAVNYPCSNSELLEALSYIVKLYVSVQNKKEEAKEEVERIAPPTKLLQEDSLPIPDLIFEQFKNFRKDKRQIGGSEFHRKVTLEDLKDLELLPQDQILHRASEVVYTDLGRWGREHLCRSTFICERFTRILALPEEMVERVKAAILLYPICFSRESKLLRKNYLVSSEKFRQELSGKIKNSAMKLMSDLKHPEVGELIAGMARFISSEEETSDEPTSIAISCLSAAELIDRACFQNGYWSSRGGYLLLKEARAGRLSLMHPSVLACMVKFLNEAVLSLPQTFMHSKEVRENPDLKRSAEEVQNYVPEEGEKRVALDALEPGMRLSKPVYAFDGREILKEEVLLDQDLIWRLWQLSTVRPMNAPLVVESGEALPGENEGDSPEDQAELK